MKPLKSTIPIRELQTLIRQWNRRGLKEAALQKVLELYLGLPNYMNNQGKYPVYNFYDLARLLRFRTAGTMLEAVKLSESFGWEPGDNKLNVGCFYSPLWCADGDTTLAPTADTTADVTVDVTANLQQGSNIYNINNNNYSPPEANPSEEGRNFFQKIKENPMERAEYLEPLIAYFQQQEAGVPREEACADVVYLVNELLIPHFIKQEKFMRMKHNGRLSWLKNLLKSGHGKELMRKAAEAGRQRRALKKQQELLEVKLHNRPLSPYEWTDPASGKRFYEDAEEGQVTIPADAPPRPSDGAFWNVIKKSWT